MFFVLVLFCSVVLLLFFVLFCSGFELNVSWSRNAIYFSIIAMRKKSHFTILTIKNFVQNTQKNTCQSHLCCWDHVCKVSEWCLVDCFHREFRVSTQRMVRDYQNTKTFSVCCGLLMNFRVIFFTIPNIYVNSNPGAFVYAFFIYGYRLVDVTFTVTQFNMRQLALGIRIRSKDIRISPIFSTTKV